MRDVSEHSEFCYPKKKKKKKEKRCGHMIKCLLTELGRAGWENIWPEVMAYGPTQSISTYYYMTSSVSGQDEPNRAL